MDTADLEALLEAGAESQKVDFKQSCSWNAQSFAKDILAFSNLRGGGYIIIGLKEVDGNYQREGVSAEHAATYVRDTMKDQVAGFADPAVDFLVHNLVDRAGKAFIVIEVKEFEDIPVICKKDSAETNKSVIYYRNIDRRPESAPISNSYDMRSLLELAAIKMMRAKISMGWTIPPNQRSLYDAELEGL